MALQTSTAGFLRHGSVAIMVGLFAQLMLGCASFEPYRTLHEVCNIAKPPPDASGVVDWESAGGPGRPCADKSQVSVTGPVPFSLNFVEIDEQGVLVSRQQADAAIENASEGGDALVVVFVHGWHHNASTDDSNVRSFYSALEAVSRWNPTRQVKGIYVGWRGDSLPVKGLRYITFWDRKNTSDEVGRGSLFEFLLRLEREVKSPDRPRNRLVMIGHSFGASVTFNALAHLYMQRFIEGVYATASDGKQRFRGYGDLVVLVNPAIEAMRYMPFQSAVEYHTRHGAKRKADFSAEPRPYLVVLSSKGDWATRKAFPAARFLSTMNEGHDQISVINSPDKSGPYSEWAMDRDTLGNFPGFKTHHPLHLGAQGAAAALAKDGIENCRALKASKLRKLLDNGSDTGEAFPDSGVRMQAKPGQLKGAPYIVADVGTEIITGHTDIGRPNLICWINQLVDTEADEGVDQQQPVAQTERPSGDAVQPSVIAQSP